MGVSADHARHADAFQVVEDARRPHNGVVGPDFAGRIFCHQRGSENGPLAHVERGYVDHRLRRALAAVIAGEFAERPFGQHIAFAHGPLDHQFGPRRNWQADRLGIGQFEGMAHHAAGDFELRLLCAEYLRRNHEQYWIDAVGDHDLACLAVLPPRFAVEQAVLAWRTIKADAARAMQHLPIATHVDTAGMRRGGERDVARADISAAVSGPEFWRRKTVRSISSPRRTTSLTGALLFGTCCGAMRRFMIPRVSAIISAIDRLGLIPTASA